MRELVLGGWRAIGWTRWPSLILVLLSLALATLYRPVAPGWTSHGAQAMGRVELELSTRGSLRRGRSFDLKIVRLADDTPSAEARYVIQVDGLAESGAGRIALTELPFETSLQLSAEPRPVLVSLRDPRDHNGAAFVWRLGRPR